MHLIQPLCFSPGHFQYLSHDWPPVHYYSTTTMPFSSLSGAYAYLSLGLVNFGREKSIIDTILRVATHTVQLTLFPAHQEEHILVTYSLRAHGNVMMSTRNSPTISFRNGNKNDGKRMGLASRKLSNRVSNVSCQGSMSISSLLG
jgi:hypothetical protein